jgi:hypothetical protein
VIAYFAVVIVVLFFCTAGRARAEFADQTLDLGRQMAKLALAPDHSVTPLVFNGQHILMGSTTSEATPDAVLKQYEQYCKSNVSPAFANFDIKPLDPPQAVKDGFVRVGEPGGEGAVVCFVRGPGSKATTKEAFDEFGKTGRLGAIGQLRYAYASRGKDGKTLVLTAWTDSKFNTLEMFPPSLDHDVPGSDYNGVPRIANSLRMISISTPKGPYGMNVYKTNKSPTEVVGYFDHEMRDRGWFIIDPQIPDMVSHGYMKDGVVLTLTANETDRGNFYALGMGGVTPQDHLAEPQRVER